MAELASLRIFAAPLLAILSAMPVTAATADNVESLQNLSLEELGNITVSSVLKSEGTLNDAAGSIFVITQADIRRSGATTIPEILRLAPNLQVAQINASRYVITARGMSGNEQAQNFPNKLLILIDGRSAYAPLFSGIYWDSQDVVLADVERIEILSGPGGTLWGANAVTGVINIITRKSAETQGLLADAFFGNEERGATLRFGGSFGESLSYRLYAKGIKAEQTDRMPGVGAGDGWKRFQGGFRADWTPSQRDLVTVQGDIYRTSLNQPNIGDQIVEGHNLLARWTRENSDGQFQLQAYYDRTSRTNELNGIDFKIDTFDIEAQRNLTAGAHSLVFGAGARINRYRTVPIGGLAFSPSGRSLKLGNIFAQDTISLGENAKLTLGLKYENYPYDGEAFLPNAIFSWRASDNAFFWASASQAVRSATPFDTEVVETVGTTVFVVGDPDYRTEKVTAYELGARLRPHEAVSLAVTGFYQDYDDLRSIEITPVTLLPLRWGNGINGHNYGLEASAEILPRPWWRLTASYNLLFGDFRFKPGSSGLLGIQQVRNDPKHQASLRSAVDLGSSLTLDAQLRYVGRRPQPRVPGYVELNASLGWQLNNRIALSLTGANLLHKSHVEYVTPGANRIPRRVMVGIQWTP